MKFILLVLLICVLLLHGHAWTTKMARSRPRLLPNKYIKGCERFPRLYTELNDDISHADFENKNPAGDQYAFTTKSEKKLVFDEEAGRFYETSLAPDRTGNFNEESSDQGIFSPEYEGLLSKGLSSNEMVPTKLMFANSKYVGSDELSGGTNVKSSTTSNGEYRSFTPTTYPHADVIVDLLESDYDSIPPSAVDISTSTGRERTRTSTVEICYNAWNKRDMEEVVACFSDTFQYDDTQYSGVFVAKDELRSHFEGQAKLLPSNSQIVLDLISCDEIAGKIGTQWHVETTMNGASQVVPFTRGCSFYTLDPSNGLIKSGMRVSEMFVKPSEEVSRGLVQSLASIISLLPMDTETNKQGIDGLSFSEDSPDSMKVIPSSIIEQYFEAWNSRDITSALECFTEDCMYETEDPVFVSKMYGKEELRAHLENNAAVLPTSCQIVLDDVAVDKRSGNIAARWHLELAQGISAPNLRGCSMYTTDPATGLLKNGYDVTEAPVKLPKTALALLGIPARLLFGS